MENGIKLKDLKNLCKGNGEERFNAINKILRKTTPKDRRRLLAECRQARFVSDDGPKFISFATMLITVVGIIVSAAIGNNAFDEKTALPIVILLITIIGACGIVWCCYIWNSSKYEYLSTVLECYEDDLKDMMEFNNMNIKIKEIKKDRCKWYWIIIGIAVVVAIIPFCVTLAVSLNVLKYVDTDNQWIGFWGNYFGGIVGAIITVLVFKWTIKNNRFERNEEHRIQVLPAMGYKVLNVKQIDARSDSDLIFTEGFPQKNLYFELNIKNIGLGSAQECRLGAWRIGNKTFLVPDITNMILQGNEITVPIVLDFPGEKEYDEEIGQEVIFFRQITYKDIFGNLYGQEIPFKLDFIKYYEGQERKENVKVTIINLEQAQLIKKASE